MRVKSAWLRIVLLAAALALAASLLILASGCGKDT